jgi:N-sulfoglucosamine sulfohydrolase
MTTMKNKLLLAAAMVFLASAHGFSEAGQRPNILWIIAEDMSPDIGCYGNRVVSTPNIDQLATEGMKFNTVFTTGPACSPSRTSLATGVYQTTLGAFHMRYSDELKPALPEPVRILPELMREQGYYTGNIREVCNTGTGKDDWLFKTAQKSWDTQNWGDLIQQQPFFAQIHFTESHRGFKPNKTTPVAKGQIKLPPYYPDHPVSRQDWAGYLEEVNTADERVGAILKKLEQDGLAENTIVFFFSDHGRPMIRGKNWLYDSGTRIPLVIYVPEKIKKPDAYQAGSEHSGLISSVDMVAETLLMAGGGIPDWMQGRSFLRADSTPRKYVYTAVDRIGDIDSCSRAVRTRNFKYIKNFKTPGSINESSTSYRRATHPIHHLLNIMGEKDLLTPAQEQLLKPMFAEELYDLENDPYETVNLVGNKDFEAVRKELEDNLSEWIVLSKDKGLEKDSDAIIQHFRAYGVSTGRKQKNRIRKMRSSVEKHFDESLHN